MTSAGGDPSIDYNAFEFAAAIDWVELKVPFSKPSQPQWVQRRMPPTWRAGWVQALTDDESRTSSSFTFNVHDPVGPRQLLTDLQRLVPPGAKPLTVLDIEVTAVEVAFDAYHCNQDHAALAALASELYFRQSLVPGGPSNLAVPRRLRENNPRQGARITSPDGAAPAITRASVLRALQNEWSINAGERDAEFTRRWYVKTKDSTKEMTYQPLASSSWRARAEVTFRGTRMPFTTLDEWGAYRWQDLQTPFFSWRVDTLAAGSPGRAWRNLVPRLSLREGASSMRKDRRTNQRGTAPDRELNRLAKNALVRLTRQQSRS